MAHPKAYQPVDGYKYQILCKHPKWDGKVWEHCDYAVDNNDKKHLLQNYRLAYTVGYEFKTILLPKRFWPKSITV